MQQIGPKQQTSYQENATIFKRIVNICILIILLHSETPPPPPIPNLENPKLHLLADQEESGVKKKQNKKVCF